MDLQPETGVYLPYREAYARAGLRWGDAPRWLSERREHAWTRFVASGFPTFRDEDWKYTPVTALAQTNFQGAPDAVINMRQAEAFLPFGCKGHVAVFVNGHFHAALSRLDSLPVGVSLSNLHGALARWPAQLESHVLRFEADDGNPFVALNAALAEDGVYLHVAEGVELDDPVFILHLTTGTGSPLMTQVHHVVAADAGSRFSLFVHHASLNEDIHFSNTLTEVGLAKGAAMNYIKLQDKSPRAYPFAQLRVRQEADSRFTSRIFSFGGLIAREDVGVDLAGAGAVCELDGLYLADGRQHTDTHTRIDHSVPSTTSRENYRGILAGRARAVFNGRVVVRPGAQKTDARQANHNLLLSRDAEVDTKPQLEIYADDVKCSHGATVGQLDEDMVFYLRSRGLDETTARAVLTYAFAAEMVQSTSLPCVREMVAPVLLRRLPGGSLVQDMMREN